MRKTTERDLSSLIDSTEDLVWSVDLDYGLVAFNNASREAIEHKFGIHVMMGMRPRDLLPPEEAAKWPPLYQRALSEGSFRIEYPQLDGRTVELAFNPVVTGGATTGISVFARDISERKLGEKARLEAEKKHRDIFDGALEGIFQTSIDGELLGANRSLARMLGYDSVDDMMSTVKNACHDVWVVPEERARLLRELQEHGSILGHECRLKRKDGTLIWVSLSIRRVCGEGEKLLHLGGFIQDISSRKQTEKRLRDSEERYRASFEQAAVGIVHTSFEGRILRCNQRFAGIVGYASDELRGMTFQEITPAEDLTENIDALERISTGAIESASFEKRYVRKDGSLTWVMLTVSIQRDGEGRPVHYISLAQDINARKQAEERLAVTQEALRVNEERYRIAFQMTLDAVNLNRLSDGMYIECNKAFLDIEGYTREEVVGRTSLELNIWADPRDRTAMTEIVRQSGVCRNLEARFRKKNGEIFWGLMSASLIELDGVPCVLSVTRDISEAKMAEDKIRNLAFYDPLTGLPNRRLLMERLRQTQAAGRRSGRKRALLFVDLDNFKTLNDTLGHSTGDLMLQEVARRLSICIREADTVARLGGDEFVVMLEDLSEIPEDAAAHSKAVAEKILANIGQPYLLAGRECLSTSSIGITVFGDQKEDPNEILQQADIAMYQAKAIGRNTMHFFAPALQAAVNARAALEEELRMAIRENQFVLWYQPQVDRGRLIGVEALLRWKHPQRGVLLPGDFIPAAEETGLILPLGIWVLETAFSQASAWANSKKTALIRVAVNVSVLQFRQHDFVEQVLAALDRTGANPECLMLEITESMLLDNIEDVMAKMTSLKSHGLRFSLDDFGTGYSSLAYLKRLPLDELKIDRTFVRDILADTTSRAIAQAIISLSRAMGLSMLAEGVETEEQRAFLAHLGCHSFQGYLFSRPLPPEDLQLLLTNLVAD
jgi:diguanylate cyclase (GGDEF)-like protein/PAS domain S-box-containing protein